MKQISKIVKDIDFSYLYLLSQVHIHQAGIAVFEKFEELNHGADLWLDKSCTIGMCKSGFLYIKINDRNYKLHPGNAVIIPPGCHYQVGKASKDFHPLVICISAKMIAELFGKSIRFKRIIHLAHQKALLPLKSEERASLQVSYELIKYKFEHGRQYTELKELLKCHISAIFQEIYGYIMRNKTLNHLPLTKHELLFQNFIRLVVQYHKEQHLTAYYAEQLQVSSKYLAATIKKISNKSAKEWIDSYIITTAREMLCSSNKSIQQITAELHFSDQAFFCKFFKRYIKISPKDYRFFGGGQ